MGDYNTTKVLNTFFSKILGNLNIAQYLNCEAVLKRVVKYRNHPSIHAVGEVSNNQTAIFLFKDKQKRNLEENFRVGDF